MSSTLCGRRRWNGLPKRREGFGSSQERDGLQDDTTQPDITNSDSSRTQLNSSGESFAAGRDKKSNASIAEPIDEEIQLKLASLASVCPSTSSRHSGETSLPLSHHSNVPPKHRTTEQKKSEARDDNSSYASFSTAQDMEYIEPSIGSIKEGIESQLPSLAGLRSNIRGSSWRTQDKIDHENLSAELHDIDLVDPGDPEPLRPARWALGRTPNAFLSTELPGTRLMAPSSPGTDSAHSSEYDILVHSDIWSETDAATRVRAARSRFPPPFRHIRAETMMNNRPTPVSFEDEETEVVQSNPSSPTDPNPIDGPPIERDWDDCFLDDAPHETYQFENDFPYAAPLLRKIIALPHHTKVQLWITMASKSWKEMAAGLDKAVKMGKLVVDDVMLNAQDLREVAHERYAEWAPGLYEVMWELAVTARANLEDRRFGI